MFKIISTGWQCQEWILQTLRSIRDQTRADCQIMVVYDKSSDQGAGLIEDFCVAQKGNWYYRLNEDRRYAVRNQYEGLQFLGIDDEDIIIFLDLDGDQFAHPQVLQKVDEAYQDGTLLTYGSYKPIPDEGTSPPAQPFPADVIAANSYRDYINRPLTPCCFNHLRTMKGRVFNSIPLSYFQWESGKWYTIGADYAFMVPGLERAGHRHKFLPETLLLYNHDNPNADFRVNSGSGCVADLLKKTPLEPLCD